MKEKKSLLNITIKEPLNIDYDAEPETILEQVMDAIEQSTKFMMKGRHHLTNLKDK